MNRLVALLSLFSLTLAGCVTSHVMVGQARAPISPDQVRLYSSPPANYEEIAILDSSSEFSFAFTGQGKTDVAINRMKEEAAKLGANGIMIRGVSTSYVNSGPGFATSTSTGSSSTVYWDGGWSDSVKNSEGIAIYVPGQ